MFKHKTKLNKDQVIELINEIESEVLSKQEVLTKWNISETELTKLITKHKIITTHENLPDWVARPQKGFASELEEKMYYDMIETIEKRKVENSKSTKEKMHITNK